MESEEYIIKSKYHGFMLLSAALSTILLLLLASSFAMLYSGQFSRIESGKVALQAQGYAEIAANNLKLMSYDNLVGHGRSMIAGTEDWEEEIVLGEENIVGDENKQRIATVKIYRIADTLPRYSLEIPLSSQDNSGIPVGTVIWFASTIPPRGFIECNGQSTSAYPKLNAIVGNHVPDLRGQFIRGWDHGKGIDVGRDFNSLQADTFKDHTHGITLRSRTGKDSSWDATPHWSSGDFGYVGPSTAVSDGASVGAGIETRPKNIALLPCIKY